MALTDAWVSRTSAADNNWRGICWSPELSLFVAVANSGTGNRVMTSPDGINWTTRASAADNGWLNVCWSPELLLFVAVANSGTGNRVMTSPDGINWTTRTSAVDNSWEGLCWSPELLLFVAVAYSGTGNRVMTSPDGINWTTRTSAADNQWLDVCWSPELSLFVAVANSGTGDRVMTWSFGKLALTLDENLAAIQFKARAVTVGSGEVIGRASGSAPGFNLPTLDARPCHVIVSPDVGDRWYPSTIYAIGDHVFPSDPIAKPYYYKRLIPGTSGATEPTWPTTPGGQCDDGAVAAAWELVERLVQPVTQGPLIPA